MMTMKLVFQVLTLGYKILVYSAFLISFIESLEREQILKS